MARLDPEPNIADAGPAERSIVLLGLYGGGNLGNGASVAVLLGQLRARFPAARITGICGFPEQARARHELAATSFFPQARLTAHRATGRIRRLLRAALLRGPIEVATWVLMVWRLRHVDAVLVPGTGILEDLTHHPFNTAFNLLRWCVSARLAGARLALVSVGAGPIVHPLSRVFLRACVQVATFVSYRDLISRDYMVALGAPARAAHLFPDMVFALPLPQCAVGRHLAEDRTPVVGVGVMSHLVWLADNPGWQEHYATYLARMGRVIAALIGQGCRIKLLIGEDSDLEAAKDLLGAVQSAHGIRLSPPAPVTQLAALASEMAEIDIAIVSRFHNLVTAVMSGIPSLSLGYTHKSRALMEELGLLGFHQELDKLDDVLLLEQFGRLRRTLAPCSEAMQRATDRLRARLATQFDLLERHVRGTPEVVV